MENALLHIPSCSPEEVGIPSAAVERYIRSLDAERIPWHDILVMRRGKLCCEAYWKPFHAQFRHRLYSCSKSFVALAAGLLIDQGLLSMEDKVLRFFPEAPADPHPWLAEMTIHDLLRMRTCYEEGTTYAGLSSNWIDTFFTAEITHKPGQVYAYSTTATTMLCVIIRRVCGKEFMELLRPAFDALGISREAFCVEMPDGYEWGGSGVCLTAREFLRFADLCTHYGKFEGQQLLPEWFVREAVSKHSDNTLESDSRDIAEGYGYHFRVMREGFVMRGMGGQYALCFPERELTIVINAYEELSKNFSVVFKELFERLLPELREQPLPADPSAQASLAALTEKLKLPLPKGAASSPLARKLSGKTFRMTENRLGWRSLRFDFSGDEGVLTYVNARGEHTLRFGFRDFAAQPFPETHYSGRRIGTPYGKGYDCLTAAAWSGPDSLAIYCHIADIYHGNLRMTFGFGDDWVTLRAKKHAEWFMDDYEGFASGFLAERE